MSEPRKPRWVKQQNPGWEPGFPRAARYGPVDMRKPMGEEPSDERPECPCVAGPACAHTCPCRSDVQSGICTRCLPGSIQSDQGTP